MGLEARAAIAFILCIGSENVAGKANGAATIISEGDTSFLSLQATKQASNGISRKRRPSGVLGWQTEADYY